MSFWDEIQDETIDVTQPVEIEEDLPSASGQPSMEPADKDFEETPEDWQIRPTPEKIAEEGFAPKPLAEEPAAPQNKARLDTVNAFRSREPSFKQETTPFSVIKDSIVNLGAGVRGQQFRLLDTGEVIDIETAQGMLDQALHQTLMEVVGDRIDPNNELQDIQLSADLARSDDVMEKYQKIADYYPEDQFEIRPVDYTGNGDWLFALKEKKEGSEWMLVNKPGLSVSDIGTAAGAMLDEGTAAGVVASAVTAGAPFLARFLSVVGLESAGAYLREKREQWRGYQTADELEMGQTAVTEGILGGAMEYPLSMGTKIVDIRRGAAGTLTPTKEGYRAQEIAEARGYRHLTPGMLGEIATIMERQRAAFAPEKALDTYQQFQQELTDDISAMLSKADTEGMSPQKMLELHDEIVDSFYLMSGTKKVDVVNFGESLQQAFKTTYLDKQAKQFSELLPEIYASAKGDVEFSIQPVKDFIKGLDSGTRMRKMPEKIQVETDPVFDSLGARKPTYTTVTDNHGLIRVGSEDMLISPPLKKTLNKIAALDPNVKEFRGVSGLKQLHDLRKELDQFAWETSGNITAQDRRVARMARQRLTDAMMSANGGGEVFQQQFKKFNADYKDFAEIRDFSQLQQLIDSDNPAKIASQLIYQPKDEMTGKLLKYLKTSLPPEEFSKVAQEAKNSLVARGNITELGKKLAEFEDNPVAKNLLFTPREFTEYKELALSSDVLKLPEVRESILKVTDNIEIGQELISSLSTTQYRALAEKGGEPFKSTIRAGFLAELFNAAKSDKTALINGVQEPLLDLTKFAKATQNLLTEQSSKGRIFREAFSEEQLKELSDIQFWAQVAGKTSSDVGTNLIATSKVANLQAADLVFHPVAFGASLAEIGIARNTASLWFSESFGKFIFGGTTKKAYAKDPWVRGALTGITNGLSKLPYSTEFMADEDIPEEIKPTIQKIRDRKTGKELTDEDWEAIGAADEALDLNTDEDIVIEFEPLSSQFSSIQETDDAFMEMSEWDRIISGEGTRGVDAVPAGGDTNKFLDIPTPKPKPEVPTQEETLPKIQGSIRTKKLVNQVANASNGYGRFYQKVAALESAMGKKLYNPKSRAWGVLQFIPSTWEYHAERVGLEGVKLKEATPEQYAKVADDFTEMNATLAQQKLGRAPTDGELYLYHHFGSGGGNDILDNLNRRVKDVLPSAYKSNKEIIGNKTGRELLRYLELSLKRGKFAKNHSLANQIAALR